MPLELVPLVLPLASNYGSTENARREVDRAKLTAQMIRTTRFNDFDNFLSSQTLTIRSTFSVATVSFKIIASGLIV